MTFTIRRRTLLLAGVLAALAVGGGVAYATIPDASGTIHACFTGNGQLRVIDPSAGGACKNNEQPLSWNQTGPPGPPGQDGTNGTNGSNGTNGTNGVSGWEIDVHSFPLPPEGDGYVGTAQADEVNCSAGKKVLGGGVTTDDWVNSIVRYSGPNAAGTQWRVIIQRTNDGDSPLKDVTQAHVYAICASVG